MGESTAPGHPGIPPRWTSSAKNGVGTAIGGQSRVWFTISHGIVNEVYYPRIDKANTRDLGLLVADGSQFFSEEKRDATSEISPLAHGVPGYRLRNTCKQGRYRIIKVVAADPWRDVLLQRVQFEALQGQLLDYHVYALLAPHIGNCGYGNSGWCGEDKGAPMLFASRGDTTLALACSVPFSQLSCGYIGVSDGWQDIRAHKRMRWSYAAAPDGNIALTGAVDLSQCEGTFVLALAFGRTAAEAGLQARTALVEDFDAVVNRYHHSWEAFQAQCLDLGDGGPVGFDLYRVSTAVLKTHEAKNFPGGMIASLSVPWGFAKGDEDLGGYHLAWPRDLVESAGGLLAAGDSASAAQTLPGSSPNRSIRSAWRSTDGYRSQCPWRSGSPSNSPSGTRSQRGTVGRPLASSRRRPRRSRPKICIRTYSASRRPPS